MQKFDYFFLTSVLFAGCVIFGLRRLTLRSAGKLPLTIFAGIALAGGAWSAVPFCTYKLPPRSSAPSLIVGGSFINSYAQRVRDKYPHHLLDPAWVSNEMRWPLAESCARFALVTIVLAIIFYFSQRWARGSGDRGNSMKRTSIIILTILAVFLVEQAFGDVLSVRIRPGAIEHSPCRVKVALTNDAVQFGFSFRTGNETNAVYSSVLRIYDGDHLVTLCPVAQSRDGDLIRSEFTVGIRNLSDSKFFFTENGRFQGSESTSPTQYWFFLRDFVETTKP